MQNASGRIQECPNCGRTFNGHVNHGKCPSCGTETDNSGSE